MNYIKSIYKTIVLFSSVGVSMTCCWGGKKDSASKSLPNIIRPVTIPKGMEKSDGARKQKLITGILESYYKDKSAKEFPHVPEAFIKSKFDTAFQEKLFKLSSKELQELSDCLKKESEAKEAYSKLEKAFGKKNPKSKKVGGQQNIKTVQELYTVYEEYLKDVQLKLINPQFNRVKQNLENKLAQLTNHQEKFQKLSAQDQIALQPLLEQATTLWKEVITASRLLMDNAFPIFYDAIHSIEEEELKRSDKSACKKEPVVDGGSASVNPEEELENLNRDSNTSDEVDFKTGSVAANANSDHQTDGEGATIEQNHPVQNNELNLLNKNRDTSSGNDNDNGNDNSTASQNETNQSTNVKALQGTPTQNLKTLRMRHPTDLNNGKATTNYGTYMALPGYKSVLSRTFVQNNTIKNQPNYTTKK